MSGRLKLIDYESIVAAQKPWTDPTFPHGKYALFIDHKKPTIRKGGIQESKKLWTDRIHWKRASDYYGGFNKFKIFEGVDPSDIIMGACNNCYALAALTGMAEAHFDELRDDEKGARIKDNFMVTKVNKAGCYAVEFIVDGQPRIIVVDDYFPFTYTKKGAEVFAFCKGKAGENEIWVQILEKAWAKLCGSYEASEFGRTAEFFQNFDGVPAEIHWTDDYELKDEEEKAKFFDLMEIAD